MLRFALFTGLALGLLPQAAPALPPLLDTIVPGLSREGARPFGAFDSYATLPSGDRVVYDGTQMRLEADDGTLIAVLGTTAGPTFPSFVLPDPTSTYALIAESSRGKIYKVDLAGGGAPVLTDLDYSFDAAFEDAGHVLVSAAPCGFNCGNEIYRVDVATGAQTLVASVSGPSGPVALAANGDLYYGTITTGFPPPPSPILRWTHAQLGSGVILDETNATVFVPAIAPASSMRFDPVYGHLFVASPVFGGTSQIQEFAPDGHVVASVVQSSDYLAGVELLRVQGIGSFQAFQPIGVNLKYRGTDYSAGTSEIRTLRPRRPRGSTSGPGLTGPGSVTFTVHGAYPNASFLVMVGHASLYQPVETPHDTGFFLFHTGIPQGDIRRLTYVATDAAGDGSFTFYNPGSLQGTLVFQAMVQDPNGVFVGSSTAAFN